MAPVPSKPANDTTPDRRRSLPCPGCGEPVPATGGGLKVRHLGQRWHLACWEATRGDGPARGGRRPGAGRPLGSRTTEPTRVLSVRVPAAQYERLRTAVLSHVALLLADH